MAQVTSTINDEAADLAASGKSPKSILTGKMMGATSGASWNAPLTGGKVVGEATFGGSREQDFDKHSERAFKAEQSLRAAVKRGYEDPAGVIKGLNPSFLEAYPMFLQTSPQRSDPAFAALQAQVELLSAELGKNFTSSGPNNVAPSLTPFDLENPSHLIYWFETPLRAKIAREPGKGTSHRTKVITGVSGSQTGGADGNVIDISFSEQTSFASWPGTLPSSGLQAGDDVNINYKFMGLSESLSWLAQFAGVGFEDISSLANLVLMQEFQFGEEYLNIAGTATALNAPTHAGTARSAATGETAISGVTQGDVWVCVTAKNYYGETVSSTRAAVAWAAGQVIDVVITPHANDAAQQYAVYVGTTSTDPTRTGCYLYATSGATKVTIQGALPTAGTVSPSVDTGTSGTNRWEGILSVMSGKAQVGSGVYPSGFQGGYFNGAVQDVLNLTQINTALQQVYNGSGAFRASPEELFCDGIDAKNLSQDVAKNGSGTNYQLLIEQNQMAGVIHGTAVSQLVNPITRRLLNVTVHPGWLQGTAFMTQWTTPNAARNANVWEMRMVQDLLSVAWPVIDPTYRYSMFEYGTFFAQAPQYAALLGGLQKTTAAAGGTYS
jgi:hypothetical protein